MQRRIFVSSTASMLAAPWVVRTATADSGDSQPNGDLDAALQRFAALPGTKSYLVHVGPGGSAGQVAEQPDLVLFTASAYKTFVLGQYLRDVEAGLLSEDEQLVRVGERQSEALYGDVFSVASVSDVTPIESV